MEHKTKIGILGGDSRQIAVCSCLAEHNAECAVWGIDGFHLNKTRDNIVRSSDWKGAVKGASAIILPLPLTTDGVRLNCGNVITRNDSNIPRINEIIQYADKNCMIFAGKTPLNVKRFATEHNKNVIDYYESEEFQIKNAVPTAEGAISDAISEMDITLSGCNAAVVGYGRIGRTLALRLISLGCKVSCIARNKRDLAWAESDGCTTVRLDMYLNAPKNYDVIFNTVPSVLFDSAVICKMGGHTLIIDLASLGGGVDVNAAEAHGIRVIKALSLPGKYSPGTAGKIIYEIVKESLFKEGIL